MDTLEQRLNKHITTEPNTGCWLWLGCIGDTGYGTIRYNKKMHYAHRLSYMHYKGPIPDGLYVCHKCDVRWCINPEHLFLGTHRENLEDAAKKGRMQRGVDRPTCKLSEAEVIAIFNDPRSEVKIAKDYGVGPTIIGSIKNGRKWKHLNLLIKGE